MNNITIVVVNNVLGRSFVNLRWSLRQGDLPSMHWFAYGIDPLIDFLNNRLQGIVIHSLPLHGPCPAGALSPLPPLEERYKVIGYADDLKPAVTSMEEFLLVDQASALFERSSGCKLHRDPTSGKCKFLPLGRWRGTLTQEDIPCPYMVLSDHLDMVGVELRATPTQTRKVNGDILQSRIKNTVGPWQAGKFMPLSQRPWSINSYALSKVWYKCNSVELRVSDITSITSKVKSWLYADQLEKPEDMVIYRPAEFGGLGMHNVQYKAQAMLTRSFLETAANPKFLHSLYHTSLFRYHVLKHRDIPEPGLPPFYSKEFFDTIRNVHETSPLNVATMTSSQWYTLLLENNVTMMQVNQDSPRQFRECRAELASPQNDWKSSWHLARLQGLDTTMKTFLWKLLHQLLPTQQRLNKILSSKVTSPNCQLCQMGKIEDLHHCFFQCHFNQNVHQLLLQFLSLLMPGISTSQVLVLGFEAEPDDELPVVWFVGHFLKMVWQARADKKSIQQYQIRAELEARATILRKTRHLNSAIRIGEMIDSCFSI